MVVKIRLARFGRRNTPFYNIVVTQARYVHGGHQTSHSLNWGFTAFISYQFTHEMNEVGQPEAVVNNSRCLLRAD